MEDLLEDLIKHIAELYIGPNRVIEIDKEVIKCQTLSRLMEMIHIMLYEEESKGLDGPRGYLQDGPRAVT